jgi:4-amino-4-deoxy-L-arabinose transferase-like glycosyltransferase
MASKRDTTTRSGGAQRRPKGSARGPWLVAIGLGLSAYLALFYSVPLPLPGGPISRLELLEVCIFFPNKIMADWFGDPPQFVLVDRAAVLLAAAGILACSGFLGRLLLRLFRADRGLTPLETLVFSFGVGLNAVSLYVLGVGLAGGLGPRWLFFAPAAVVAAAAAVRWGREWGFWIRDCGLRILHWRPTPFGREPAASASALHKNNNDAHVEIKGRWLWLAAPFALVMLLAALLPPVDFDVREYHLQAPKEFYEQGQIAFLPYNVYGNMPLGSEMLSLLAMVVMGDWWYGALAGKTVIAAAAPLTALALLAAGRRFFSTTAGVVAALVYISIPWIAQVSTSGLIEGTSALYMFLAVYAALLWRDADAATGTSRLALAGFMSGAAVACKYPGALFVLLPLAAYVVARLARVRVSRPARLAWPARLGPLGVFLLAATVACGPWFAKNWALTGNPTYPLQYSVFDGKTRTDAKNAQFVRAHRTPDYSIDAMKAAVADVAWRSPWLSPLVTPLAVLAVAALTLYDQRHRRVVLLLAGYFGFVIAVWWLCTHRIDRFWIPALSVASLLAGVGADQLGRLSKRWMLIVLLIVGLTANFLFIVAGAGGWNAYFVSLARLRLDPGRVDAWHLYLNEHVPPGGAVLCVGDAQVFDLEMPVYYSTVFDDCLFEQLLRGKTAEERRAALRDRNISCVFVHWPEIARYRSPGNYGFTDYVQPEVLDELVTQGVLLPPLPRIEGHDGQVYPVKQ